jgi:hypothetical protein
MEARPLNGASPEQGELFSRRRRKEALDMDLIRVEKDLMKVPLLFVMNGDDRQRKHVETTADGKLTLRYVPMGSHEVRVLCALMAMLQGNYRGVAPLSYSSDDASPEAEAVWLDIGKRSRAAGGFVSELRTSRRQIAEIVRGGKAVGGDDLARVMESLVKLQSVQIQYESADGRREYSMNLLAGYAREDDTLSIVLNPRLVKAVDQRVPGLFSMLSLREGTQLRLDAADLLYRRLSAVIDQGGTLAFRESTLIGYLWIQDGKEESERAPQRRRQALRKALKELTTISPPWEVVPGESVAGEPKYIITRPSARATKLASMKGPAPVKPKDVTLRPMK